MVDITSENFEAKLEDICQSLQSASFVSIDCEFTGLHLENHQPSFKDSAEQRYGKLKKSVQLFNIVQIGLSAFRFCNQEKVYFVDTFNFYLFPRSYGIISDLNFVHQNTCVEFLCKHEFDFNKLFYKGVSYLNRTQEKILKSKLQQGYILDEIESGLDRKKLQQICSNLTDWVLKSNEGDTFTIDCVSDVHDFFIQKEIKSRFKEVWTYHNGSKIIVEKVSNSKRNHLEISNGLDIDSFIEKMSGFTKVFNLLIEYKKPLIFHNGFMDVLFVYEKFIDTLPDSVHEFKKRVRVLFPNIYDTKHISIECKKMIPAMKDVYDSTVLESLNQALNKEVEKNKLFNMPAIKISASSDTKSHFHEAGYDAYITGSVFLKLAHILTNIQSKELYSIKAPSLNDYFQILKPFKNNIPLIKASLNYINLNGKDPAPHKSIAFFVKTSKPITTFQLNQAFSSYGYSEVYMISSKTAYVVLSGHVSVQKVLLDFQSSKMYDVSLYSFWKHSTGSKYIIGAIVAISGITAVYSIKKALKL